MPVLREQAFKNGDSFWFRFADPSTKLDVTQCILHLQQFQINEWLLGRCFGTSLFPSNPVTHTFLTDK